MLGGRGAIYILRVVLVSGSPNPSCGTDDVGRDADVSERARLDVCLQFACEEDSGIVQYSSALALRFNATLN